MTDGFRYKTILLFGAPGAGKGTQGTILSSIPGFYHHSTGDVFRNLDVTSDLGKIFYEYASRGELVPDELTVQMWAKAIRSRAFLGDYKPRNDLLILDGIPRTAEQARILEAHIEVLSIIHLTCDDPQVMFDRLRKRALKSGRADDADSKVIENRWNVYLEQTKPVLDHYSKDKIHTIDAVQSPAAILSQILAHVAPIQEAHFKSAI